MTLKEEMLNDMKRQIERQKRQIERQKRQIMAQWWIIGLLCLLSVFLAA